MAKWCNAYGCWRADVEEITDYQHACDLDCNDCEDMENVEYTTGSYKVAKPHG